MPGELYSHDAWWQPKPHHSVLDHTYSMFGGIAYLARPSSVPFMPQVEADKLVALMREAGRP